MADPTTTANGSEGELEDEIFGNLRLKRSRSKSGYYGVTKVKSAKKPYQAWVKSAKRRQQGLGSFATAKEAAIRVATALAQAEGEDLESPRQQSRRGSVKAEAAARATISSENVAPRTEIMPDKLEGVPVATPSCLPPEALRALAARGMVGSVARILDA
uniref:AP2/ERF domain-containing protein n=1 Tax=Haptolina ericina TaxID=156174 RepID=A0A7S3AZE8_9EUKA|mmetsp:Transcript_43767/g.98912  ORF Transcript_43767/g.98912 Transcript_43767/m.98912 type:complete len:159 (+) Transcript_43767:76-552(+)|eukprot:CAMPEP_0181207702 /NCGR_PEP_ID=MMETSP1096-20121128/21726_1 /TAXON_ID=156174 ORGANISM="Chrysochromulina ericina, Strain CCMP281" /NCGR_SAMPLE_ID=MMETSP1096 /ASSEMBLY_ACC=CAM_ASM_000453 /LENGTH=158 /DNA_ID=CAMNT_0023298719 /DNA_START=230 /DNA_END=706 /DNA_ORIENTATION=-